MLMLTAGDGVCYVVGAAIVAQGRACGAGDGARDGDLCGVAKYRRSEELLSLCSVTIGRCRPTEYSPWGRTRHGSRAHYLAMCAPALLLMNAIDSVKVRHHEGQCCVCQCSLKCEVSRERDSHQVVASVLLKIVTNITTNRHFFPLLLLLLLLPRSAARQWRLRLRSSTESTRRSCKYRSKGGRWCWRRYGSHLQTRSCWW